MPDAATLERTAEELRSNVAGSILETSFTHGRSTLIVEPKSIKQVLGELQERGYSFLASLHGVDYYPEEPRLGILYELLDMKNVDRITVKARVSTDNPRIDSVIDLFPGADFPEREVYDMFGVEFEGHRDLRRILMPEDYEGFPQRRDFPTGGEPILFTFNEQTNYGRWL